MAVGGRRVFRAMLVVAVLLAPVLQTAWAESAGDGPLARIPGWLSGLDGLSDGLSLQVHGFVAQGVFGTTANQVYGAREDLSAEFRSAGLNASLSPRPGLDLSAQLLYRNGSARDDEIRLDFALANLSLTPASPGNVGARLGRFKNRHGLFEDTHDIPRLRPSVLLAQSIYSDFDDLDALADSVDGAMVYADRPVGNVVVGLEAYGGRPRIFADDEAAFRLRDDGRLLSGRVDSRRLLWGVSAFVEDPVRGMRLGIGYSDSAFRFTDGVLARRITRRPLIVSAAIDRLGWSLTAEAQATWIREDDEERIRFGSYVQATRDLTPWLTGLVRADLALADLDDPNGQRQAERTGLPEHRFFARDATAGLRFRFGRGWLFDTEIHAVDGTQWLSEVENSEASDLERTWALFGAQLSYTF